MLMANGAKELPGLTFAACCCRFQTAYHFILIRLKMKINRIANQLETGMRQYRHSSLTSLTTQDNRTIGFIDTGIEDTVIHLDVREGKNATHINLGTVHRLFAEHNALPEFTPVYMYTPRYMTRILALSVMNRATVEIDIPRLIMYNVRRYILELQSYSRTSS